MGGAVLLMLFGVLTLCAAEAPTKTRGRQVYPSSQTLSLANLQDQFTSIAEKVAPSVVAVSATTASIDAGGSLTAHELREALSRQVHSVGTGMILSADGYILTSQHVLAGRREVWVTADDGTLYPAVVVGADHRRDLAVLKIPAMGLAPVTFGADRQAQRGQWVFTLGNPSGIAEAGQMAMSVGILSATQRTLPELARRERRDFTNLMQSTAETAPGSSGGPLFDLDGNVIGINVAVVLPSFFTTAASFAIPVTRDLLREIALLKQGRELAGSEGGADGDGSVDSLPTMPRLRWRGLVLAEVPPHWPRGDAGGLLVVATDGETGLGKSSIAPGTIITAVAGTPVRALVDLQGMMATPAVSELAANDLALSVAVVGSAP